jgi:hypothetical protein
MASEVAADDLSKKGLEEAGVEGAAHEVLEREFQEVGSNVFIL